MDQFFDHAWVLFLIVTTVNGLKFRRRALRAAEQNPGSKDELDKLIRGWFLYANIPWVVMAVGELSGMTRTVFDYFTPRSLNPAVLAFHASIIVIWILSAYWIYFNDGAESLARNWAIFGSSQWDKNDRGTSPAMIKVMLALMITGGCAALSMMWFSEIPVPKP